MARQVDHLHGKLLAERLKDGLSTNDAPLDEHLGEDGRDRQEITGVPQGPFHLIDRAGRDEAFADKELYDEIVLDGHERLRLGAVREPPVAARLSA
jgi:hypothetical protein